MPTQGCRQNFEGRKQFQKLLKSSEQMNLLLYQLTADTQNALLGPTRVSRPAGLRMTATGAVPRVGKGFPARYFSYWGF